MEKWTLKCMNVVKVVYSKTEVKRLEDKGYKLLGKSKATDSEGKNAGTKSGNK